MNQFNHGGASSGALLQSPSSGALLGAPDTNGMRRHGDFNNTTNRKNQMSTKPMQAKPVEPISEEYKNMVDLLAVYSEASNRLAELETQANRDFLESMDEHKGEYAKLQETLTKAETALQVIVLAHPEWFESRKSVRTPFGTIKLTKSTKLDVPNEEVTVVLLEKEADHNKEFKLETYVRQVPTLNLEALEKLDDALLSRFRINRVRGENVKIDAARVDMGKAIAVKETAGAAA